MAAESAHRQPLVSGLWEESSSHLNPAVAGRFKICRRYVYEERLADDPTRAASPRPPWMGGQLVLRAAVLQRLAAVAVGAPGSHCALPLAARNAVETLRPSIARGRRQAHPRRPELTASAAEPFPVSGRLG